MKIPLVNISNNKREITLFMRNKEGKLYWEKDNTFFPYFYEFDREGKIRSYDGHFVRRVTCIEPSDIKKKAVGNSWESNVPFVKRYLIDKIDEIIDAPIRYSFIDIEVLSNVLPQPLKTKSAPYPISCISISDSFSDKIYTFFLGDYEGEIKEKEEKLIKDFIRKCKEIQPDLWLGWNLKEFDWPYLQYRIKYLSEKISPIRKSRWAGEDIFYPCGMSILDYMLLYRKVETKKIMYTLDYILENELGKGKEYKELDFNKITIELKKRNIEDVRGMLNIEKKKQLIPYYNEIRKFSLTTWEDLPMEIIKKDGKLSTQSNNSRIIDMLILRGAKELGYVLPNKSPFVASEFRGAERGTEGTGRFFNISAFDLSGAYPNAIIDFCLDSSNIVENLQEYKEEYPLIKINDIYFKQNHNALFPIVTKKILNYKNKIKVLKSKTEKNTEEYKRTIIIYEAAKSICNSIYGILGNPYFRIYDYRVAGATTYLVRDILEYTKRKLKENGYDVIYCDTDGVFIKGKEDISNLLNEYIKEWGNQYNKKEINIQFDYEGYFDKIFIKALCHYVGYKHGQNKPTIKGIEGIKRNSSLFVREFQPLLIDKVLENKKEDEIIEWIYQESIRFRALPLENISFPAKIYQDKYAKTTPIHFQALQNAQYIAKFNKKLGDLFYWVYVISQKKNNSGKLINVMAFDNKQQKHIENIDWDTMIEKNIIDKALPIFNAMGWSKNKLLSIFSGQNILF